MDKPIIEDNKLKKIDITKYYMRLTKFFNASIDLIKILARACKRKHFNKSYTNYLTTWKKEMSEFSSISFGETINDK